MSSFLETLTRYLDEFRRRAKLRAAESRFLKPLGRKNRITEYVASAGALRKRLAPAEQARIDGRNGLPDLRSTMRGTWEQQTIAAFQDELNKGKRGASELLRDCDLRLKKLPPAPNLVAEQIVNDVDANLAGLKDRFRYQLVDARREMRRRRVDFIAFQEENGLRRKPSPPRPVLSGMSIFAIFLLDVFVNFQFLWQLQAGSASWALGIIAGPALISVTVGLATGLLGIRYLAHKRLLQKLRGAAVTILGLATLLTVHIIFADYRAALDRVNELPNLTEVARTAALNEAFRNLVTNALREPFAFVGSGHAIEYFLWGMFGSGIAIAEGVLLIRDRYPGYLTAWNEYQNAKDGDVRTRRSFEASVAKVFSDGETKAYEHNANGRARLNALKGIIDEAAMLLRQYEAAAVLLESGMHQVLSEYRTVNRRVRETPGPAYFNDDWPVLDRDLNISIDNMHQVEEVATNTQAALADSVNELITDLTRLRGSYTATVTAFLDEIETDPMAADLAEVRAFGHRETPL